MIDQIEEEVKVEEEAKAELGGVLASSSSSTPSSDSSSQEGDSSAEEPNALAWRDDEHDGHQFQHGDENDEEVMVRRHSQEQEADARRSSMDHLFKEMTPHFESRDGKE